MTRDDLRAALRWPNIGAFLRLIRQGESNQDDSAYTLLNGGDHFTDFGRHPFAGMSTTAGGKAAGAYQFIPHTWQGVAERYGFANFTPREQDEGAVALILEHGAGEAIKAGDLATAFAKLKSTWISLPPANAERLFVRYGGILPVAGEVESSAPISTPTPAAPAPQKAVMPLLLALLPAVLNLFAPRAQAALQKVTGASPDIVAQFAQSVIGKVQEVTGKADPVQAVAAITADPKPQVVQAVEDDAMDHLDKLLPALDKVAQYEQAAWDTERADQDAAAARGRTDTFDLGPMLAIAAVGLVALSLLSMFTLMGLQSWLLPDHEPTTAMLTLVGPLLGIIFTGAFAAVYAYRFGSSRSSSAKDAVLGELAKRGK